MIVKGLFDNDGNEYEMEVEFSKCSRYTDMYNISFILFGFKTIKKLLWLESKERYEVHKWAHKKRVKEGQVKNELDWVINRTTETTNTLFGEYLESATLRNNLEKLKTKQVTTNKGIIKEYTKKL